MPPCQCASALERCRPRGPRADQWRRPSIDHLSDRDFIGFEDNGRLIVSPVARPPSLHRMGIDTEKTINVGSFTSGQKQFLDFHRNAVLLQANRR